MSCRELEGLFLADAPAPEVAAHRSRCRTCDALARDEELAISLTSALAAPPVSAALRRSLLEIPRLTLSCDAAADALARGLEGELREDLRTRLEFHLGRCAGCAEAAGTLGTLRELVAPQPGPWFAAKVVASRPRPQRRSPLAWFWSPKGAIAAAYAAAVLVMLLGFNPADVTRVRGVLKDETRVVVQTAGSSVADRLGALSESVYRRAEIFRGRFGAYGRAALSNALNLVMRPENPPPTSRPRSGDRSGPDKTQTELMTWRA